MKWERECGCISLMLPNGCHFQGAQGIVLSDIVSDAHVLHDSSNAHRIIAKHGSRRPVPPSSHPVDQQRQEINERIAESSAATNPEPDHTIEEQEQEKNKLEQCTPEPQPLDPSDTIESKPESVMQQAIAEVDIEDLLIFDLSTGRCIHCHDGELHNYCSESHVEGDVVYFDPHWTEPRILFAFPNGLCFEALSYREGRAAFLNVTSNQNMSVETTDCRGIYMESVRLPAGSKRHTIIQMHSPPLPAMQELEDSAAELTGMTVDALKRPSTVTLSSDAIHSAFPMPEETKKTESTLMLFREIVEFVPNRERDTQARSHSIHQ